MNRLDPGFSVKPKDRGPSIETVFLWVVIGTPLAFAFGAGVIITASFIHFFLR